MTLLHNMKEASEESAYWTPTLVIQAIIGIWFAASHQPWTVSDHQFQQPLYVTDLGKNLHFVFLELCARPEYFDLIRKEIESVENLNYENITKLPILDSFIKETSRLNPTDKSE